MELTEIELKLLVSLCAKKARHLENYISVLDTYDEEDTAFIAKQIAELVFYQNIRDKLQKLLNEQ